MASKSEKLQAVVTALLRHELATSLAEVEAHLVKWRAGEVGLFEAHTAVLHHAARSERMAERMATVDSPLVASLVRDAFDAGLIGKDDVVELTGKPPEELSPSPPEPPIEPALPDKQETVAKLLEDGPILVHIDAGKAEVSVPEKLRGDTRLVLRFGYGLTPAINDLTVDQVGLSGTLSFAGVPHRCVLPWHAIYAVVGEADHKGMVWPEDVPAAVVDELTRDKASDGGAEPVAADADGKPRRGTHLKLVE